METVQANVDSENQATFLSPCCGRPFNLSVTKYKNIKHELTIRCNCREQFQLLLDFRRFHRNDVILVGEAKNLSKRNDTWNVITVVNLSIGGLRFKVLEPSNMQKGDKVRVRFTLDDPQEALIDKEVIVRNTRNNEIGCEYMSFTNEEKDL